MTWPNVLMNVDNKRRFRSSYVAGDWNSLLDIVGHIPSFESSTKQQDKVAEDIDEIVSVVNGEKQDSGDIDDEWCVVKAQDAETENNENNQFDLILTAETCYTEVSCQQVAQHLLDLLKADLHSSIGLVASKRFYFGTGGSASYFRQCCVDLSEDSKNTHSLSVEVVQVIDDGKSNIREIMLVRKVTK